MFSVVAGCSSGGGSDAGLDAGADLARPAGPAADVVGPLSGGKGVNLVSRGQTLPAGWVEEELALEGTAVSYTSDSPQPADGRFELHEGATADYRTRIIVRRPGAADGFNGTVIVEWLNVSAGVDGSPDFTYLADELYRGGYAWVGVSAQHVAIEGGPVLVPTPVSDLIGAGKGLRVIDPERYGALHHPGDAFAYDIYTQVARTLRAPGAGNVLGPLVPARLLAVGESQSAMMLTTYANGVQPLARQYDGFLIHSRAGGAPPLGTAGAGIDLLSGITGPAIRIRTDLDAPVLMLQTETDVLFLLNSFPARQPDTDRFRLWEAAGTAHADAYVLGDAAGLFSCGVAINDGPCHFVAKAALRHLDTWSRNHTPPPEAARLQIDETGSAAAFSRDSDGNALGGIRTPLVDVPLDTLSGAPASSSVACTLFGSTTPLTPARIAALYPSRQSYLDAYTASADATITAGFVLADDRAALLADADPSRVGN